MKENIKINKRKNSQNFKKEILSKINKFFKEYKENLENRDFLIIYKNNGKKDEIFLRFLRENFLHLTGINRSLSSFDIYKKLEKKNLRVNDITLGKFTEKKLQVYSKMIKIFKEKSKIGTYDPNNLYQKSLSIDKGMALSIPDTDMVLGIRIIGGKYTVPVSLLQQKLENISYKETITDIICTFEKNVEEEKYSKLVYNIEDIKELLQENEGIKELLTEELLKEIYPEEENISDEAEENDICEKASEE